MGCFVYLEFRRLANSQCIPPHGIPDMEIKEAAMLNDVLFLSTIFVTRILLPIGVTFVLGSLIERVVRHGTTFAA
jgi:hypothetical protein